MHDNLTGYLGDCAFQRQYPGQRRLRSRRGGSFHRLLEVADHMERALQAAEDAGEDSPLADGLRLIHRELMGAFREEGLERIEVVGRPFDPEIAEAVAVTEVEPERHDLVLAEVRPGYRIGERIVRPAQVQVGRSSATPSATREAS